MFNIMAKWAAVMKTMIGHKLLLINKSMAFSEVKVVAVTFVVSI